MYELKLLTPEVNIPNVECMYQMKKIGQFNQEVCNSQEHDNSCFDLNILEKKIQLAANSGKQINMIVERQMQVIQQLEALQTKLAGIREKCKISAPLKVTKSEQTIVQFVDIVINAHPNYVPYSLLALRNIWKNDINVNVTIYKHSGMPKISKEAQYFEQQLAEHKAINKNLPTVQITLIWMDCEQTAMISSEANYVPIYGEVNISRYLARIGTYNLQYEHLLNAYEIDSLLDNCHQVLCLRNPTVRKDLLTAIVSRLGNEFLFDKQIKLPDIMVYCTLKQAVPAKELNLPDKDLNTQFKAWRSRVEHIITV